MNGELRSRWGEDTEVSVLKEDLRCCRLGSQIGLFPEVQSLQVVADVRGRRQSDLSRCAVGNIP